VRVSPPLRPVDLVCDETGRLREKTAEEECHNGDHPELVVQGVDGPERHVFLQEERIVCVQRPRKEGENRNNALGEKPVGDDEEVEGDHQREGDEHRSIPLCRHRASSARKRKR